eukprot:snap_masked-scaffold_5-processed-gene-15.24-mRNA-1 protein AED:0.06 eAED:0.06 QI:0/-1/0/1/-1/1/1/0/375
MSPGKHQNAIVIDNGSNFIKVGVSKDINKLYSFPSIVGRHRCPIIMVGMVIKDYYVGSDARNKRGILRMNCPIENSMITNWDNMEKIWHFAFYNVLQVDPAEFPVLLTEPPLNPKGNREKMTQIMFETFNIPHLCIELASVLSLYNNGKETGVVLDSGESVTHSVPVYKGFLLVHGINRLDIGGRSVNNFIIKLMYEKGFSYISHRDVELINEIKNTLCYVSSNVEVELKQKNIKSDFELPDGNIIQLGSIVFEAPELMFHPFLMGYENSGVHDIVLTSVNTCEEKIRRTLFSNILLAGGNTLLTGFKERLEIEIKKKCLYSEMVKVFHNKAGEKAALKGGIKLASSSVFLSSCISREEYEDNGPSVIHSKNGVL